MNKKIKTFLILFLAVLCVNWALAPCFAADKEQIEKQRTHAKKQINKLKLRERIETGRLYKNQKQLEKTQTNLNLNKAQYENTKNKLEKIKHDLDRQIAEYNEYQKSTNKRIVQIYKSRRSGYVEFLFSSGDVNDFLDRIYYENLIMNIDKKNIQNARSRAASIRNLKQQYEREKENLAVSIKVMDKQQKSIQNAISQNERLIYNLQNNIKYWEKSERELAKQSAQLEGLISSATKKDSTTVTRVSGGFLRPVSGGVTSSYGYRIHPIFKRRIYHSGVDLGMPMGSPVKASNSGKVIYVGWYGGYGKVVIIDHGKVNGVPVSTLYAHLSSYRVSNGASVTKGQVIGNVGSTGYSTGPHLHFEVRENGKPVNPSKYAPI